MNHNPKTSVFVAILAAGVCLTAPATTIFDTSSSYNGNSFTAVNGQQIGTEILLPGNWSLTNITVEYLAQNPLPSTVGLDVQLYVANGTPTSGGYATPGTLLFDSGFFYGLDSGTSGTGDFSHTYYYNTNDFASGGLLSPYTLPGDFILSVSFTNTAGTDLYGIQLPAGNNVASGQPGSSYGDYWLNSGSGWNVYTNSFQANLIINLSGTGAVPEPSTLTLVSMGSLIFLGLCYRNARSKQGGKTTESSPK